MHVQRYQLIMVFVEPVAPETLGTRGHVPLHFGKWLGTGHRRGIPWNESRIKETLLDQVWRLTRLLLVVPATSATAERNWVGWRHTCELRWARRDWTTSGYCTATRTEPTSWTWRPFPRNLSVHETNVLILEITWNGL